MTSNTRLMLTPTKGDAVPGTILALAGSLPPKYKCISMPVPALKQWLGKKHSHQHQQQMRHCVVPGTIFAPAGSSPPEQKPQTHKHKHAWQHPNNLQVHSFPKKASDQRKKWIGSNA